MANELLIAARERLPSRRLPGEPMPRPELVILVNEALYPDPTRRRRSAFNANYLGKLERGIIHWPKPEYRAALREVLGVSTDAELGFFETEPDGDNSDLGASGHGDLVLKGGSGFVQSPNLALLGPRHSLALPRTIGRENIDHAATDAKIGLCPDRRTRTNCVDALSESSDSVSADLIIVNVVVNGQQHVLRLSRRGLFEAVTGGLVAPLLGDIEDIRGPVDPAIVDHFAALRAVLVESDNRFGAALVLPTVRFQLGRIAQFRRNTSGILHGQLLGTEARWAEFAGWLCDDLGEQAEGAWWLDQAMSQAFESNDTDFSSYVLARKAQRASSGVEQDRVLGLAQAAVRVGTSHPQILAFATLQRAHGHALAGDTHDFEVAIGEAQTLVDGKGTSDGALGSFCTAPYTIAQEGEGWLRLKQPKKAASRFNDALARWPVPHERDRGLYLSRAAVAQVASKQHDEAATTALQALRLADKTRSMRVRSEVEAVGRRLAPFRKGAAVASLLTALAASADAL